MKFHTIKGRTGFVQRFADLGIFRELFLHETGRIANFCRVALGKMLEYGHDNDTNLRETLMTLLDVQFNYKAAAEKLYVHVNTVRYRCEKIEQLLGIDLRDPDQIFRLYVAVRVGDVLKGLMQVLDKEKKVIPGLYAAGNNSGSFFGNDYPTSIPGESHGRAQTFGYKAGKVAAKEA